MCHIYGISSIKILQAGWFFRSYYIYILGPIAFILYRSNAIYILIPF